MEKMRSQVLEIFYAYMSYLHLQINEWLHKKILPKATLYFSFLEWTMNQERE
jgi:hypothetical protein